MPFSAFTQAAEAARAKGCHVFVQCLPKMGSTALSHSLHNADHEVDMASAPRLMQHGLEPGFDDLRLPWLQQRRQQLGDRIDVCTSLFLITAPLQDQQLEQHSHRRLLLNRSLRPWLRSISNWSFQYAGHPLQTLWEQSYRHFVALSDPELQGTMPPLRSDLRSVVRFWMPVWLVYQHWLEVTCPGWRDSTHSLVSDDDLIPAQANQSQFSEGFLHRFDQLIPAMPDLTLQPDQHQAFAADLRHKLLERSASSAG